MLTPPPPHAVECSPSRIHSPELTCVTLEDKRAESTTTHRPKLDPRAWHTRNTVLSYDCKTTGRTEEVSRRARCQLMMAILTPDSFCSLFADAHPPPGRQLYRQKKLKKSCWLTLWGGGKYSLYRRIAGLRSWEGRRSPPQELGGFGRCTAGDDGGWCTSRVRVRGHHGGTGPGGVRREGFQPRKENLTERECGAAICDTGRMKETQGAVSRERTGRPRNI